MITRETIYAALFARLQGAANFQLASRKLRHWSDVSQVEQPALFQAQRTEQPQNQAGMPTKWGLQVDVYVYAWAGGADTPASIINPLVDAIEAVLAPDNPMTNKCTLGGLAEHVWIDGQIQTDEGVLGDQGVAIIPISILAS